MHANHKNMNDIVCVNYRNLKSVYKINIVYLRIATSDIYVTIFNIIVRLSWNDKNGFFVFKGYTYVKQQK